MISLDTLPEETITLQAINPTRQCRRMFPR
jgi:hypothetical protein